MGRLSLGLRRAGEPVNAKQEQDLPRVQQIPFGGQAAGYSSALKLI